jgi:hypothetical protein
MNYHRIILKFSDFDDCSDEIQMDIKSEYGNFS